MILDMLKSDSRDRARARHHRPRRGAHRRPGARRRLLGGHDALPDRKMHARPRGRHGRDVRRRAHLAELRVRLGPQRPAGRAEGRRWRCAGAGTPRRRSTSSIYGNPLRFLSQNPRFTPARERRTERLRLRISLGDALARRRANVAEPSFDRARTLLPSCSLRRAASAALAQAPLVARPQAPTARLRAGGAAAAPRARRRIPASRRRGRRRSTRAPTCSASRRRAGRSSIATASRWRRRA